MLGLLVLLCVAQAQGQRILSATFRGVARFFGGPQDGVTPTTGFGSLLSNSCGYQRISLDRWPNFRVVALSPESPLRRGLPLDGCGMCVSVECVDPVCGGAAPVVLYMIDQCDECSDTDITMSALAFEQLAPFRVGQVNVVYRRVDCDPTSNVIIRVDTNRVTEGGWVRLSIQSVAGGGLITDVQLVGADGVRRQMVQNYGATWELSGTPEVPWSLIFTTDDDQTVQVQDVVVREGQIGLVDSNVQIPLSSLPPRAPPTVPPPTDVMDIGGGRGEMEAPDPEAMSMASAGRITDSVSSASAASLSSITANSISGSGGMASRFAPWMERTAGEEPMLALAESEGGGELGEAGEASTVEAQSGASETQAETGSRRRNNGGEIM